jgi:hypothetical protein
MNGRLGFGSSMAGHQSADIKIGDDVTINHDEGVGNSCIFSGEANCPTGV